MAGFKTALELSEQLSVTSVEVIAAGLREFIQRYQVPGFTNDVVIKVTGTGKPGSRPRKPRARKVKVNGGSVVLPPTNPPALVKISELPVGHVGQSVKNGNGRPTDGYKVQRVTATRATFIDGISSGRSYEPSYFSDWYRDLGPQPVQSPAKRERSHSIC